MIDINDIQEPRKELNKQIQHTLAGFASNDYISVSQNIPKFYSVSERKKMRENIILQLSNQPFISAPNSFSKSLLNEFSTSIDLGCFPFAEIQFLETVSKEAKSRFHNVMKRFQDPFNAFPNIENLARYISSITEFINECHHARDILSSMSVQNQEEATLLSQSEEFVIKNFLLYHERKDFLHISLHQFLNFPLIQRYSIFECSVDRIIDDILNPQSLPLPCVCEFDKLIKELSRLSSILSIDFDLNDHDGQYFTYLCEKAFHSLCHENFPYLIPDQSKISPSIIKLFDENVSCFEQHIFQQFYQNTKLLPYVVEAFENIIRPDVKYASNRLHAVTTKMSLEERMFFAKDRALAYYHLLVIHNRKLLDDIIQQFLHMIKILKNLQIKSIMEIEDNDLLNALLFDLKRYTITGISSIPNLINYEIDSIFEKALSFENRFNIAKIHVLECLMMIYDHSDGIMPSTMSDNIKIIAKKILFQCPSPLSFLQIHKTYPKLNLNGKPIIKEPYPESLQQTFFDAFLIEIERIELYAQVLQVLINTQIMKERELGACFKQFYPYFEFPDPGSSISYSSYLPSTSHLENFSSLYMVINFLQEAEHITNEIMDSFSIQSRIYKPYFSYAVWKILLKNLSNNIDFMFGLSIPSFNLKNVNISSDVLDIFNSHKFSLDPTYFIINYLQSQKEQLSTEANFEFEKNYFLFLNYMWYLRNMIFDETNLYPCFYDQTKQDNLQLKIISEPNINFKEVVNSLNVSAIQKIVNIQNKFVLSMKLIIRYNNFWVDESFLNSKLSNGVSFFITGSSSEGENVREKCLHILLTQDLFSIPFSNSNFERSIIYSLPEVQDQEQFYNLSLRVELAILANYECNFLSDFIDTNEFNTKAMYIISNDGKLNHYAVLSPLTILNEKFVEGNSFLEKLLSFLMVRIRLMYHIRLSDFFYGSKERHLEALISSSSRWEESFFATLASEMKFYDNNQDLSFSLEYFQKSEQLYCLIQQLAVFYLIDDFEEESMSASILFYHSITDKLKKSNSTISEFQDRFISINRYVPQYLQDLLKDIPTKFRQRLIDQKAIAETRILSASSVSQESSMISSPRINIDEKLKIIRLLLSNEELKITFYFLLSGGQFYEIIDENGFPHIGKALDKIPHGKMDQIYQQYKSDIIAITSRKVEAISQEQTDQSSNIEWRTATILNEILKRKITLKIQNQQKQKADNDARIILGIYQAPLQTPSSVLKPDSFTRKKKNGNVKFPYRYTPDDANAQFEGEIKYTLSRFAQNLYDAVKSSISSIIEPKEPIKEKHEEPVVFHSKQYHNSIFEELQSNDNEEDDEISFKIHEPSKNFNEEEEKDEELDPDLTCIIDSSKLFEKLAKISKIIPTSLKESIPVLYNMWLRILEGNKSNSNEILTSHSKLDAIIMQFHDRYWSTLGVELLWKFREQYMALASLRNKETEIEKLQGDFVKQAESEYRKWVNQLIIDLEKEINKKRKQFVEARKEVVGVSLSVLSSHIHSIEKKGDLNFLDKIKSDSTTSSQEMLLKDHKEEEDLEFSHQSEPENSPITKHNQKLENSLSPFHSSKSLGFNFPEIDSLIVEFAEFPPMSSRNLSLKRNSMWLEAFKSAGVQPSSSAATIQTLSPQMKMKRSTNEVQPPSFGTGLKGHHPRRLKLSKRKVSKAEIKAGIMMLRKTHLPEEKPKYSKTEERIEDLKKETRLLEDEAKKLRIARTLINIGLKKQYGSMTVKAKIEKKEASSIFWHARREMEEEMGIIDENLKEEYQKLTELQIEGESIKKEVEDSKYETAKLTHENEMQCMKEMEMENECKELSVAEHVNITQLRKQCEEAFEKLEKLKEDANETEQELKLTVREPMEKVQKSRREIQKVKFENAQIRMRNEEAKKELNFRERKKLQKYLDENEVIANANKILRQKIIHLEKEVLEKGSDQNIMFGSISKRAQVQKVLIRPGLIPKRIQQTAVSSVKDVGNSI